MIAAFLHPTLHSRYVSGASCCDIMVTQGWVKCKPFKCKKTETLLCTAVGMASHQPCLHTRSCRTVLKNDEALQNLCALYQLTRGM
jgi:hypothetical protein